MALARGRGLAIAFLLAVVALTVFLAGCGGGDDDSTAVGTAANNAKPAPEGSSAGSAAFIVPGGDNSIVEFGKEAGAAERKAASVALSAFMAARADEDFEKACTLIVPTTIESAEEVIGPGQGCVATFATLAERLPPGSLANTMTGPIASLRSEGVNGFALYHGTEGVDYFMQMSQAPGGWRVNALEPTAFP